MPSINLKRFVDIDIKQHVASVVTGTRDVVILYTEDTTDSAEHLVESYAQAETLYKGKTTTLAYLKVFFDNGGAKVLVVEGKAISDVTKDVLVELDNQYICIAYASSGDAIDTNYAKLKALAQSLESDTNIYGINEKMILAPVSSNVDTDKVKNFVVKFTDKSSPVVGIEMSIAAYLSKIDVYGTDTVYDYAFTKDNVAKPAMITDSDFVKFMDNNINVDAYLANAVRNCGGNCKDGSDIVNTYVKIILHQTITEQLIGLLTEKIKNTNGVGKIYSAIASELERYKQCGYLTIDKSWTDETWRVIGNDGVTYTVIEQGTPLTNGYVIKVLPMTSLSAQDRAQHKAPNIYVAIADQYGVRSITIKGEVI